MCAKVDGVVLALTRRKPMDLSLVGGHYDALQHSVAETRRERDDRRERRQREDELRLRWLADVARIPEWHGARSRLLQRLCEQLEGESRGVLTGTHLPLGHSHGTRKALGGIVTNYAGDLWVSFGLERLA